MNPIQCEECVSLLEIYVDGELDAVRAAALEQHLAGCAACSVQLRGTADLRTAIRECVPYFRAPADLRRALQLPAASDSEPTAPSAAAPARTARGPLWTWSLAAGLVLSVTLNASLLLRRDDTRLADQLFNAHLRSLQTDHTTDVLSTDQHTVKPWFAGKLEYSPEVRDLSASGFPLVGARIDYVEHRKIAVLVYRHRLHIINVFVRPATPRDGLAPSQRSVAGYHLIHWSADGMTWWAISDLNDDELATFARLVGRPRA